LGGLAALAGLLFGSPMLVQSAGILLVAALLVMAACEGAGIAVDVCCTCSRNQGKPWTLALAACKHCLARSPPEDSRPNND